MTKDREIGEVISNGIKKITIVTIFQKRNKMKMMKNIMKPTTM